MKTHLKNSPYFGSQLAALTRGRIGVVTSAAILRGVRCLIPCFLCLLLWSVLPIAVLAQITGQGNPRSMTDAFGANWGKEKQPDLAEFSGWANSSATSGIQSVSKGIELAKRRRAVLAELIKSDPASAIASSIPEGVRMQLPVAVTDHLETHVSGIGDLTGVAHSRAIGRPLVDPIQRFVKLNERTYRTYLYGRRTGQTTKHGIPLHGIALDDMLALHPNALRELASGETPQFGQATVDLRVPAEKAGRPTPPVLANMGGKIYGFASVEQLRQAELRIAAAEARLGPNLGPSAESLLQNGSGAQNGAVPLNPPSAWTIGPKRVLVIRIDFSDLQGNPSDLTAEAAKSIMDTDVAPFFLESSYGKTSLETTVTAQLYRMPRTTNFYANIGGIKIDGIEPIEKIQSDARQAAAIDHDVPSYDRVIVLCSHIHGTNVSGPANADVGGPNVFINGPFDFDNLRHELGHTYGVSDASGFKVSDQNPISARGEFRIYEDNFDTMGYDDDARCDFNPYYKNQLGWISDAQVKTVTTSGIYRINRFDHSTATGTLALKVFKNDERSYWVGIRRKFTDNPSMQNGAYIIWGFRPGSGIGGAFSALLDMTTPGDTVQDAALAVGASFTDPAAKITIRPLANGGIPPNEFMDIAVDIGDLTNVIWVDFAFNGDHQAGTFDEPFATLADGVARVPAGGDIFLKGPRSSPATITITKPMKIIAVGGNVTIGH